MLADQSPQIGGKRSTGEGDGEFSALIDGIPLGLDDEVGEGVCWGQRGGYGRAGEQGTHRRGLQCPGSCRRRGGLVAGGALCGWWKWSAECGRWETEVMGGGPWGGGARHWGTSRTGGLPPALHNSPPHHLLRQPHTMAAVRWAKYVALRPHILADPAHRFTVYSSLSESPLRASLHASSSPLLQSSGLVYGSSQVRSVRLDADLV